MKQENKRGILYGVGVGPGDPELLTVKAVRILEKTEVWAHPGKDRDTSVSLSVAKQAVENWNEKEIMDCPVPMTKDRSVLEKAYSDMAWHITEKLEQGEDVAFLNIGDPTIYGSFSYLAEKVKETGYGVQVVSGIPSFCAAASSAGISLCEHEEQLHIIPASYDNGEALLLPGTKVFMKGGKELKELFLAMERMDKQGILVENAGMESEKICVVPDEEKHGYLSLVIVKG
ncbi:MAG: precorrin-2 C(20)-methyltransferase [Lachnospiraceae bacterium]|nr:precorrin-2 C(20)-methyltransferase [Lachnospiraceae bacterium]